MYIYIYNKQFYFVVMHLLLELLCLISTFIIWSVKLNLNYMSMLLESKPLELQLDYTL